MAVDIYQSFGNPLSGETFRALSHDTEAFVIEWKVQPEGYVPFEHVHLNQDEVFHVKKGELRVLMNGEEQVRKEGETLRIPKGARHIAYNNKAELLECIVEYWPGLDHDKFMQCFAGLTIDHHVDKKGGIHIPMMGYFLTRMKAKCMARPTAIPAPVFNLALRLFYLRGVLSGWGKHYKKYTGEN